MGECGINFSSPYVIWDMENPPKGYRVEAPRRTLDDLENVFLNWWKTHTSLRDEISQKEVELHDTIMSCIRALREEQEAD